MTLTIEHIQNTTRFTTPERAAAALKTLGWLEANAPREYPGIPGQHHFDMNMSLEKPPYFCGSIGCIGGTIAYIETKEAPGAFSLRMYFGIESSADELFALFFGFALETDRFSISPQRAARVFRHYLETGNVDWSIGLT